jgi:hypothetical protein
VQGIRVNNQHENEAIGSKVDIKVYWPISWQCTLLSVINLTNARQIYTVYRQTILLVSGRVLSVNGLTNTSANVFY